MSTTLLRRIGLALYLLVTAALLAFGLLYASVSEMLFFHAAAVPVETHAAIRPLYLALMQLIGGSSMALALLGAYTIWWPMRQGVPYAQTAVTLAYLLAMAIAGVTAERLHAATAAPVAWHNMGILAGLTLIGQAAWDIARRRIGA